MGKAGKIVYKRSIASPEGETVVAKAIVPEEEEVMKWIPILICTHWFMCTGQPIKGEPVSTYEECKQALDLALDLFGDRPFTDRYVISKCEKQD